MLITLAILLILVFLIYVGVGSYVWFRPWDVAAEVLRGPLADPDRINSIVWDIRMPRAVQALIVGGILGVVGSAFQAQLRNGLADPYIVGVSSGSAVGGVTALVLGFAGAWGGIGIIGCGFITGMASLFLVFSLARRRGVIDVTSLLLAGVAVGSLLASITSLVLLGAGEDTNRVLNWLLGSFANAFWPQNLVLAIVWISGSTLMILQSRKLNAFAIGEETASRLGVNVPRLRWVVLTTGTAMTAAAVGASGIIGFIGLVAPHISRRLLGVDWRWSLAGSGLIGALITLLADLVAQRAMSAITGTPGMELPVGIVTAIIGAPSLLILLRRSG